MTSLMRRRKPRRNCDPVLVLVALGAGVAQRRGNTTAPAPGRTAIFACPGRAPSQPPPALRTQQPRLPVRPPRALRALTPGIVLVFTWP